MGGEREKRAGKERGREGTPVEMKAPNQNPKYATGWAST